MASLTIRNLDDEVKQKLRERAARNGRSMEEEAREIISLSVSPGDSARWAEWKALQARARALSPSNAPSVVDELIAERRAEAAREDG